jgi:hypothetical protein
MELLGKSVWGMVVGVNVIPTKLDEETPLYSLAPCKMVFEITVSPPDESNAQKRDSKNHIQ